MNAIDADTMIRLDEAERDAERRYCAARDSGDMPGMKVAAMEWTAAARAATRYALEHVEPYSD